MTTVAIALHNVVVVVVAAAAAAVVVVAAAAVVVVSLFFFIYISCTKLHTPHNTPSAKTTPHPTYPNPPKHIPLHTHPTPPPSPHKVEYI